eukprot:scaffold185936_cov17-Tisochrysis_lutea.AAC.1
MPTKHRANTEVKHRTDTDAEHRTDTEHKALSGLQSETGLARGLVIKSCTPNSPGSSIAMPPTCAAYTVLQPIG